MEDVRDDSQEGYGSARPFFRIKLKQNSTSNQQTDSKSEGKSLTAYDENTGSDAPTVNFNHSMYVSVYDKEVFEGNSNS